MHLTHFCELCLYLMLVFLNFCEGQPPDSQQCENCCTYLGSKVIRLNFYDVEKDFEDARRTCTRKNSILLTEEMYDHMNVCIHKYLENKTSATMWLDGKPLKERTDLLPTFSLKEKSYSFREQEKHNVVCVSQGQPPANQQCENCCNYLGSKVIRLNFYNEEKEFEDARRTCRRRNSILLTEEMYDHMNVCIHKYLENKTSAAVWLDGEPNEFGPYGEPNEDIRYLLPTFSLKGKSYGFREQMKHSFVCVSQDKTYKAFNLIVEDVTGHKLMELDLLSPPWTEGKVFRNVSVGQTLTLVCEAEGIPHPRMIFRKDGVEMRNVMRSNTSQSIKLSVDQCGHLGIFTCEDYTSSLNRSIVITVPCGDTEPPAVEYSQDYIKCLPDLRSYTDVKIVKHFDNKQLLTVKDSDTFIARINRRCNVMETYVCVVSLKDGTTRNSTINVGFENCSLQLCPGEANNQTVYTTIGRKSIFSFCVIAHPNISNFLLFNNSVVYKNNETNFNWDYTQNSFPASYNVTVSINNVTSYGKFTVGVFTSQDRDYNLNYTIQIIQTLEGKAGSSLGTDHATKTVPGISATEVNILVVVLTVAIVVAICCLICVVLAVLLYRKREKAIKSTRSISSSLHVGVGSLENRNSDSAKLRSSVGMYANIRHETRNTLAHYSHVNMVHVYANIRNLHQDQQVDEWETFLNHLPVNNQSGCEGQGCSVVKHYNEICSCCSGEYESVE